jgi:hypothetical protein
MTSRRGTIFFWIVQVLLLPVPVCFLVTLLMRFHERTLALWKVGIVTGLVQIPFAAMALIFVIAADMGQLLPKQWLRGLYLELSGAALMITLVLYWHGVYRW